MDRVDLALLLARRATLVEAHSADPGAPVVAGRTLADRLRRRAGRRTRANGDEGAAAAAGRG